MDILAIINNISEEIKKEKESENPDQLKIRKLKEKMANLYIYSFNLTKAIR